MVVSFLRVRSMCFLWRCTASGCVMEIFLCSDLRAPGQVWRSTGCAGCEWIREQKALAPEGRHRTLDPALGFDIPWKGEEDDFGLGRVWAMIPALMRNFDAVFSRSRGNPASCVPRRSKLDRRAASGSGPCAWSRRPSGRVPPSSPGEVTFVNSVL
jgi:hypothetical protein